MVCGARWNDARRGLSESGHKVCLGGVVDDDDVRDRQDLARSHRHEARVTRTCADKNYSRRRDGVRQEDIGAVRGHD